jgi:hypothetical protein
LYQRARPIAAAQIEVKLCDAETLADRKAHAVAPIGVGNAVLERGDPGVALRVLVIASGGHRHNPNAVALEVNAGLGQHVPQTHLGKMLRG